MKSRLLWMVLPLILLMACSQSLVTRSVSCSGNMVLKNSTYKKKLSKHRQGTIQRNTKIYNRKKKLFI